MPPRRLNASIPRDLETICLKCLEKEPAKRYASAAALGEDLRRFLAGEPILARPVTRLERAVKWARRRPAIAALLGLVVLVTALGLGGVLWQWREAVLARDERESRAGDRARRGEASGQGPDRAGRATPVRRPDEFRPAELGGLSWYLLRQGLDEQLPANQGGVDRRGFEWFYWRRKTSSGQITLKGHPTMRPS